MVRQPLLALGLVAAFVLGACGGSPAASPISDPTEILTKALEATQEAKTVHVKADIAGSVALDLTGQGSGGPLELTGTTVEGDIDLAGKNAQVSFSAPTLFGLGGELIVIGPDSYLKVSLLGDKYQKSTNAADNPTGALSDPQQTIADLEKALKDLPTPPTKAPDEKCGDAECYRVTVDIPTTDVGGALGGVLGSAAPGVSGSGTIDVWVNKATLRPAKLVITADGGAEGTITATVELTRWDEAVSISAPPADEVVESSPGS
jgi:hypothetical protein